MAKDYILRDCGDLAGRETARYKHGVSVIDWEELYAKVDFGEGEERAVARQADKRKAVLSWARRLRERASLVLAHIVTQPSHTFVPVHVSRKQVSLRPYSVTGGKTCGGERGEVTEFSKQSRARMLRAVAGMDLAGRMLAFVTLTYDGHQDWVDPLVVRRNFRAFAARLERRADYSGFLWRWEYQKRGAAHFHLLCWSRQGGVLDAAWMNDAWHEITGSAQREHLLYGVRVDYVKNDDDAAVVGYLAKYAAKVGECPLNHRGRMWGIRGDKARASRVVYYLPGECVDALRRVVAYELVELQSYATRESFGETVNNCRDKALLACEYLQPSSQIAGGGAYGVYRPWIAGSGLGTVHCNFLCGQVIRIVIDDFARANGFGQLAPQGDLFEQLGIADIPID